MFQQLIQWVKALFGKIVGTRTRDEMIKSDKYKRQYEDTKSINFNAIFAGFTGKQGRERLQYDRHGC